jgi:hypothetical protein
LEREQKFVSTKQAPTIGPNIKNRLGNTRIFKQNVPFHVPNVDSRARGYPFQAFTYGNDVAIVRYDSTQMPAHATVAEWPNPSPY